MSAAPVPESTLVLAVIEAAELAGCEVSVPAARAVVAELRRLGVLHEAKPRKPWTRWSPEDDERLRSMFHAGTSVREIAETLNRSPGQIKGAITRMQLTRSGESQNSSLVHRNGAGPGRKPAAS